MDIFKLITCQIPQQFIHEDFREVIMLALKESGVCIEDGVIKAGYIERTGIFSAEEGNQFSITVKALLGHVYVTIEEVTPAPRLHERSS